MARTLECHILSAGPPVEAVHLCFDDQLSLDAGFDPAAWKAARASSLQQLEQELLDSAAANHATSGVPRRTEHKLVIVDDNMQYRSMRYECFQLARRSGAAYLQLHLACPLPELLRHNALRAGAARVPEEALQRMARVFEEPDSSRFAWEASTLVLATDACSQGNTDAAGAAVWGRVWAAWGTPPPRPPSPRALEEERAHRAADRAATAASAAHRLDLHCRAAIAATLGALSRGASSTAHPLPAAAACGSAVQVLDRKGVADALNAARRELLALCRTQLHSESGNTTSALKALQSNFDKLCAKYLLQ